MRITAPNVSALDGMEEDKETYWRDTKGCENVSRVWSACCPRHPELCGRTQMCPL